MFEDDEPTTNAQDLGPRRPFAHYLRDTPPAPLSGTMKAILWAVGVLVGLLFLGALIKLAG